MTSGLLSSYKEHLRNQLEAWQGNTDTSRREVGDPAALSHCHSDTGIPINVQQELGIVTHELHVSLEVSKGCEASCPDEAAT